MLAMTHSIPSLGRRLTCLDICEQTIFDFLRFEQSVDPNS